MEMDPKTKDYKQLTELVPLILVIFIFAIMICPFNIVYRSNRYFFLTCVVHIFLAPLYKVVLSDFFVADQLTSQVQAFRSIEFYICYYTSGDYKHRENSCNNNDAYSTFNYILAAVPFWWRMLQAWAVSGGSESIAARFHDLIPDKALDFPFELDAFLAAIAITGAHNTPNTSQLVVVFPYPLASNLTEDKKTVNKVTNAAN